VDWHFLSRASAQLEHGKGNSNGILMDPPSPLIAMTLLGIWRLWNKKISSKEGEREGERGG